MAHIFRHFPREVDMRKRKVVHSMDELQHYVKATNGADDLTTTVYGFQQLKPKGNRGEYSTAIVPHFVIDMDYERAKTPSNTAREAGNRCLWEVLALHHHLLSNGWKHAMWFTGGGVHIWVNLDQTHYPEENLSDLFVAGRRMIDGWVKQWDLTTLDPVVSFRPDRHIRIPNTYNFKRGLWGMPLQTSDLEGDWEEILSRAVEPHGGMNLYGQHGLHLDVKKRDPATPFEAEKVDVDMKRIGSISVLPCLAAAACDEGSNPPHEARIYLTMFLQDRLRSFARPPQSSQTSNDSIVASICNFIKDLKWSDYNEEITYRNVKHSVGSHYMTPSCRTLYAKGYCIGKCPFYDGTGGV